MTELGSIDAAAVAAWLLTYWLHSTLLLASCFVVTRWLVRSEPWRETLWKTALLGGVATALLQTGLGLTPLSGRFSAGPPAAVAERAGSPRAEAARETPEEGPLMARRARPRAAEAAGAPVAERGLDPTLAAVATTEAAPGSRAVGSDQAGPAVEWPLPTDPARLLVAVWLLVAGSLLGRLAVQEARVRRRLRDRRPVRDGEAARVLGEIAREAGLAGPPPLFVSPSCPSPLVLGRRQICVPARFFSELPPEQQRAALAHELAHVARRDPWWNRLARIAEAILFFQPLNRLARRRLRRSAELLADEWAAGRSSPLALASCLSTVAGWVRGSDGVPAGAAAMAEGGSSLLQRVERLLDPGSRPWVRRPLVQTGVALFALAAVGAAVPAIGWHEGELEATVRSGAAGEAGTPSQDRPSSAGAASGFAPDWRAAEAAARAEHRTYWLAYAFPSAVPAGSGVLDDTEGGGLADLEREPVGPEFGIPATTPAGGFQTLLAFVRFERGRIDRLALRSPNFGIDLRGPVSWLGTRTAEESLSLWLALYPPLEGERLRSAVVEVIAAHPLPEAARFLRRVATSDELEEVRAEAVEGLAWHGSDETVAFLADLARGAASLTVAEEAAETLGETRHERALEALANLARAPGTREQVAAEAAESLGEGFGAAAFDVLVELAMRPGSSEVGGEAAESLGEVGGPEAVELLRRIAWESPSSSAVHEAIEGLGEAGGEAALAALDEIIARHPEEEAVLEGIETLEAFDRALALARLRRIAADHPSATAREEARDVLSSLRER